MPHAKPDKHADSFEHNGHRVHIVVTPEDCAGCHPVEREQYAKNLMANAHGNLQGNPVYRSLADAVNGVQASTGASSPTRPPTPSPTRTPASPATAPGWR